MARPLELSIRMARYILWNKLRGRKRFPLVTMLEPLEKCNLACEGCGRIREYQPVIDRVMSVEEAMEAVEAAGAPVISIAGGEPLIHPQIHEIVERIIERRRFVYLCTNGLLMERSLKRIPPSKYLCFVVHMDGMEERHDQSVGRKGVYRIAMHAIEAALAQGYRVASNTTIFKGSDVGDLHRLFAILTNMGIEGLMVSPGFDFHDLQDRDVFLSRQQSVEAFSRILDAESLRKYRFYNNPLYLDFLRGKRQYQCSAWSNPTYTVIGWRKPCYPIADSHASNLSELMDGSLWEHYGVGKDPRCANCMMHCGFESATIFKALGRPGDIATLIRRGAIQKSGVSAG